MYFITCCCKTCYNIGVGCWTYHMTLTSAWTNIHHPPTLRPRLCVCVASCWRNALAHHHRVLCSGCVYCCRMSDTDRYWRRWRRRPNATHSLFPGGFSCNCVREHRASNECLDCTGGLAAKQQYKSWARCARTRNKMIVIIAKDRIKSHHLLEVFKLYKQYKTTLRTLRIFGLILWELEISNIF